MNSPASKDPNGDSKHAVEKSSSILRPEEPSVITTDAVPSFSPTFITRSELFI